MACQCNKYSTCMIFEKDMSAFIDTCIIMNIIKTVINMVEEADPLKYNVFELFCGLFKRYLKKMRLCPLNHKLITSKRLYDNEMDLDDDGCSLYDNKKFKKICESNINSKKIIKNLLEDYIFYKKQLVKKDEIDSFRTYLKKIYHRQKELSNNDLSLILLALKNKNPNGGVIITDDMKLLDCINLIKLYDNHGYDSSHILGVSSLYYLGNIYFCCELDVSGYKKYFETRNEFINIISNSQQKQNVQYRKQIDSYYRIISRPDKVW